VSPSRRLPLRHLCSVRASGSSSSSSHIGPSADDDNALNLTAAVEAARIKRARGTSQQCPERAATPDLFIRPTNNTPTAGRWPPRVVEFYG